MRSTSRLLLILSCAVSVSLPVQAQLPPDLVNPGQSGGSTTTQAQRQRGPIEQAVLEAAQGNAPTKDSGSAIVLRGGAQESPLQTAPNPEFTVNSLKLPPMMGFRQLARSQEMKNMLKNLIAADVPVMMETMMMVENGAATGYLGSINTIGTLLSNTVQASDLNMKMLDAADSTGQLSRAYVASAVNSMKFSDGNREVWPAALMFASGDTFRQDKDAQLSAFRENQKPAGADPSDVTASATSAQSAQPEVKLSDKLFPGDSGGVKQEVLDWVGDLVITSNADAGGPGQTAHTITTRYRPVPALRDKSNFMGPPQPGQFHGPAWDVMRFEQRKEVWKHINQVMRQYCTFKKSNPNYNTYIFEKKHPADAIAPENWLGVQAVDIQVTLNLVDQFFKLMLSRKPIDEIDCDSFSGDESTMPLSGRAAIMAMSSTNTTAGAAAGFDDCSGANARTCLRNVVLFEITKYIAESNVTHIYRGLWDKISAGFQTNQDTESLGNYLFCHNLQLGWPCVPTSEMDTRREQNRQEWIIFLNTFSKLAQGQGGSSVFRPSQNNLSSFTAGSVGGPK